MDKQFAPTTNELLTTINDVLSDVRDLLVGIYIQNLRIYDVLTLQAAAVNGPKTDELINLHELGNVLCPEPALKPED